jgi:hypothetical protein
LLWKWAQTNHTAMEGTRRDFDQQRSKDGGVTHGSPDRKISIIDRAALNRVASG